MNEVSFNFYSDPAKSDYSDSVEGAFTIEATGSEDTFGLEFAVAQWLKLVTNAENLFSKLVTSKFLTNDEKNQIERWLCLKQECEECVGSDDTASLRGCSTRVLERIDELTESDLKTDQSSDGGRQSCNYSCDLEEDSENELEHPDFVDKLDCFMEKFKHRTDEKMEGIKPFSESCGRKTDGPPLLMRERDNNIEAHGEQLDCTIKVALPTEGDLQLSRRRKSIHPGLETDRATKAVQQMNMKTAHESEKVSSNESNSDIHQAGKMVGNSGCSMASREKLPSHILYPQHLKTIPEPCEELKMLSAGNEAKQSQMCQVLIDLEGAQRRIEELQRTIHLKEQFIENMIKNDKMRATAKQRFTRKRIKLESEYYKTRSQLAEAEDSLMVAHENNLKEDKQKCEKDIEKFKTEALLYEKRLKNIEIMKHIAENSARKMLELENSLQKSRCQMDRLKKQLRKEEEHKFTLEQELLQDQCKIKELEEKYSVQHARMNNSSSKNHEESRLKWIQEEEERVLGMRESSQRFQEQLMQKQIMLERREAFLKQRLCLEKSKTKNISEVSARISHLNQVLKDKCVENEKVEYADEKEALRHEIGNLRRTRDCLVDQRCNLDEKFQKEKVLSNVEERKLIECDEAIEAIDAAIEYKNELICGRNCQDIHSSDVPREKGEELLLARLMKLSPMELRSLLYKYFKKVIDLRESGKKMEIQLSELDIQNEAQKWRIQALSNALQQTHLKAEQHIVMLQKEHEEEMAMMLRYFAEETSGSSGAEAGERHRRPSPRRGSSHWKPNCGVLQGPPSTKVTKEKNKLIILQQKARKPAKR